MPQNSQTQPHSAATSRCTSSLRFDLIGQRQVGSFGKPIRSHTHERSVLAQCRVTVQNHWWRLVVAAEKGSWIELSVWFAQRGYPIDVSWSFLVWWNHSVAGKTVGSMVSNPLFMQVSDFQTRCIFFIKRCVGPCGSRLQHSGHVVQSTEATAICSFLLIDRCYKWVSHW